MGFLLVTAVLVVTFGRLGDQYGRAKLFNLGFLIFTVGLVRVRARARTAARPVRCELIALRVVQGVGGAMIMANSTAIITDAFPPERRGFALGVNQVAGARRIVPGSGRSAACCPSGTGGRCSGSACRSASVGHVDRATATCTTEPRTSTTRVVHRLVGQPHLRRRADRTARRDHLRAAAVRRARHGLDRRLAVLAGVIGGVAAARSRSWFIENRVADPMINLQLFKIRAFTAGQRGEPARRDGARRSAVHADHLAAGHLAAAARLRLRRHAAVGGHLHAAADRSAS